MAHCCHTSPNERLLQQAIFTNQEVEAGCHTSPNERLLQHFLIQCFTTALKILSERILFISKD